MLGSPKARVVGYTVNKLPENAAENHELCLSETCLLSIEEDVKDFSRRQFRSFGSFRGFAIGAMRAREDP